MWLARCLWKWPATSHVLAKGGCRDIAAKQRKWACRLNDKASPWPTALVKQGRCLSALPWPLFSIRNFTDMVAERRLTAMMLQEVQVRLELVRSQESSKEKRTVVEAAWTGLEYLPSSMRTQEKVVVSAPRD